MQIIFWTLRTLSLEGYWIRNIRIDRISYSDSPKYKGRFTKALWWNKEYNDVKQEGDVNISIDKEGKRSFSWVKKW
jgi:hypothetical protein